jgi:general secretion pathway protein D
MNLWKKGLALTLAVLMTGCAGYSSYQQAKDAEAVGQWDRAVMNYAKALELNPENPGYKTALARARLKASQVHFEKGKMYRASGRPDLAIVELSQTVLLDPTNDYAEVELRKAEADYARQEADRNAETRIETLKKKTRGVRAALPMLEPASDRPINLNFPQPKPIKQIYRALADAAGINVVFDPQLKDDNVSIVLAQIEFQKALETLLRQENHFYKIIDEKTILIAADTPQNRKTYEDLVIKTFFLSNADVTEVANALRALLQTTRISVNKAENSITLRDTADKVAVAERIVEQNDKQVAEVVIDVELLQINATKVQNLGIQLVPRAAGATIPAPGGVTNLGAPLGANQFSWDQLKQIGINSFGFTIPSVVLTFIKDNTDAELLAKPQLRIAEGQKAQLLIGDRVPIPVSSFNTSNVSGANIVPITSYQYQDVGIKIEVEPRVHHNREVTLKLMTEVSNIAGFAVGSGQQGSAPQPIIGTRTISSNIRLKDGETNFLAGLYRTDKSSAKETIPFIGDIPVIGRIFSRVNTDNKTTDLVLTLTPHIIRIPDVTEEDLMPVFVGTDANISYQGGPRVENPQRDQGPFEGQPGRAAPGGRTPPPAPQQTPPPGINLAPGSAPTDIFRPTPPPSAPNPSPKEQVPQSMSKSAPASTAGNGAPAAAVGLVAVEDGVPILLDFDPSYLTLGVGQQQTIHLRATSPGGFPGGTFRVRFDPAVAAPVSVRPVFLGDSGTSVARVEGADVILELPDAADLSGTRAIAEVTLRGIAPGLATMAYEPVEMPGATVTFSTAVAQVR